jgi:hypothetical protein
MAFHYIWPQSPRGCLSIDDYVGRARDGRLGVNRRDDVMLVQWLLARALKTTPYLGPRLIPDGIYGPITDYWLCRFIINRRLGENGVNGSREDSFLSPINDLAEIQTAWVQPDVPLGTLPLMGHLGLFEEADFPSMLKTMPPFLEGVLRKNEVSFSRRRHEHLTRPRVMPWPKS